MAALLTSTDFADLLGARLLVQLTTDTVGATTPDEDVIDATSAAAWGEMWEPLSIRYSKPATCPAGAAKDILRTITLYRLYLRHPEWLATPEGEVIKSNRDDAIKRCQAAGAGKANLEGLTLLTADEQDAAGSGIGYYANDVVFDKTSYRGF